MGEVYRARDSKLNRDIAIKVLPAVFARDTERVARFTREAQVLASLNHPNIAAIYGLEDAAGDVALALEFVDGEDLSQRLARGAIPMDEALAIARQIADGLEAAHDKGIVHRDLKPANIKVTGEGVVKILDFGLAKAMSAPDGADATAMANSPTFTGVGAMTLQGVILGTAAYMAPEQARGATVDKRADMWAFGVVLMEMLTGKPLFGGDTISDVLAAVLTREVDWSTLPAATPAPIRRLLRRCIEKDRKRRLADAGSARLELDDARMSAGEGARDASGSSATWVRTALRVALPSVVVTALVVGALALSLKRAAPGSSERLTLTIVPPPGIRMIPVASMGSTPHLSPDGSAVLFWTQGPEALYVRRLDSLDVIKVPGSDRVANEPFWHGSSRITFPAVAGATRQLRDVLLPDGAPNELMTYSANVRGGGWSDEGKVFVGGNMLTPGAGGVGTPAKNADGFLYPEFIHGTGYFLAWRTDERGVGEVCLNTMSGGVQTAMVPLFKNATAARYTPSGGGRVLFVKDDILYAQRLNLVTRAVEGEPELMVRGVASQPVLARADFSVADNGTIAWRPGRAGMAQATAFDRQGREAGVSGPAAAIDSVYVSLGDESRLLVTGEAAWLVRVGDAGRAALPADVDWEFWTADGRRVVGRRADTLVSRGADGGPVEPVGTIAAGVGRLWAISPDGKFALGRVAGRTAWAAVTGMASPGSWAPLTDIDENQVDASFSPDGRFVLYAADTGIYVQPFPGPGRRQLVDKKGIDPVWRGDGKEIAYVQGDAVWSAAVSTSGGTLTLGTPQRLFAGLRRAPASVAQSQSLAVSRDGTRFYFVQGVEQPAGDLIHVMIKR
jgi:hypothetical protein